MTNSRVRNNLKEMLFQRYKKLLLSFDEVQKEVLDNPRLVPSNSVIQNTWLIDDVVAFLCTPYDAQRNKNSSNKERKAKTIEIVNKELQKYWNKNGYALN
ncbi:MAG: hypothetical protein RL154_119 [Pseudomonadota bacterium]|jgi:hypothetical protein